jgi:phosphoserine phosphatase
MLSIARSAFPVNPSPALAEAAAAKGWPLYYPAGVAPQPLPPKSVDLPPS